MPELPEVETVARQLREVLRGQKIYGVEVLDSKLNLGFEQELLQGVTVAEVFRVGKQVVLEVTKSKKRSYLAVHLRMTGRLIWVAKTPGTKGPKHGDGTFYFPQPAEIKYIRARISMTDGELQFIDVRRFGTFKTSATLAALKPQGLDPLLDTYDQEQVRRLLAKGMQPIKTWLLRQDRFVGIGNIYACEILYAAAIDPERKANSLHSEEIRPLLHHTKRILSRAIRHCGTTFSDFQDSKGELGSYQRFLKVYDREGESCQKCRSEIVRIVQQARSTFYCPTCQK